MFRSFLLIFCKGKSSAWYFFFFLNSWQRFHDRNVCISPLLHFVCINSVFYIFIYISITFPIPYISIKQRNVSFVNANHFFSFLTKVSWPKCCRHRKYWISCRLRSMQDFFILHISCIQCTCLQTFRCARGVWIEKTEIFFLGCCYYRKHEFNMDHNFLEPSIFL